MTGPNTPEGKAVASRNSFRHGLCSDSIVIPDLEFEEMWHEFHNSIVEAIDPADALEDELASRAAELLWRLRRVSRAERDETVVAIERGSRNGSPFQSTPAARGMADAPALLTIQKYETALNRQLLSTLHEIEARQARRKGEASPLARIDLNALLRGP
jgi:hypothetical protein